MADLLTDIDTIDVEISAQEELGITVGSPMEHSRILSITKNGKHVVSDYDIADVEVLPLPIQQKQITVTESGTYEIKPDDGYLLDKVEVDVNVDNLVDSDYFPTLRRKIPTPIVIKDAEWKFDIDCVFVEVENDRNILLRDSNLGTCVFTYSNTIIRFFYEREIDGQDTSTNISLEAGKRYHFVLDINGLYVNDIYTSNSTKYAINPNKTSKTVLSYNPAINRGSNLLLYSFKAYHKGVLVCDYVPKEFISDNNVKVLYDNVSKSIIYVNYFNDSTTLELPDTQTITVTNEEYEAIAPILSEMRGEELPDVPKPVVD